MARTSISGIYSITNLSNGWRYIGSSEDVQDRLLRHQEKLESGLHHLRRLQNDWVRHGRSAFDFEVLEQHSGEGLVLREQAWINKFADGKKLYNVALSAARNGSRKIKADWVTRVQKKVESNVTVDYDADAQAVHDREHKKLHAQGVPFVIVGYGLLFAAAFGVYRGSVPPLLAALGMAVGLFVANYAVYKVKAHACGSPALKAGMIRSLKIHAEKESARSYIKAKR
jgi:hypothetical protein